MPTIRRTPCPPLVCALAAALAPAAALAAPPDKVVIVIEENHSFQQVIGYAGAPYINGLIASQYGASLTNMYALTHPSQPNYVQFFSGANQNVTSNNPPGNIPFGTANLGAAVIAAGKSFTGYSQGLPAPGSLVVDAYPYARRHVPWTLWQSNTPTGNQLPPSVNLPFTSFPTDYATLPALSIVIPDNLNNMHDGTIETADAWLQTNIGPYAAWAIANNSLLIITWDEDESASRNRIPTIFYGPMVRPGVVASTWTLHGLLRLAGDMFGASPPLSASLSRPIVGALTSDPSNLQVLSFQQGTGAYAGALDTYIESGAANTAHAATTPLVSDNSPFTQMLIRFDNILGLTADKVPPGSQVLSAKLVLLTGASAIDFSVDPMRAHRMLIPWSDTDTWNSLTAGVSTNGSDAAASPDFFIYPNTAATYGIFDVTASVQAWVNGTATNYGWVITAVSAADDWRVGSSEFATVGDRPRLEVVLVRAPCPADINNSGAVSPQDIFDFLAAYFAGLPLADFNHLGGITIQDIFDFLAAWFTPCV